MTRRYGRGDGDDRGEFANVTLETYKKREKNNLHPPAYRIVLWTVSQGQSYLILTEKNNKTMI